MPKRKPKENYDNDLRSKKILELTNSVHRLQPTKPWKYINIIKKLFRPNMRKRIHKEESDPNKLPREAEKLSVK